MDKTSFINKIKAAEASKTFSDLPNYSTDDTVSTPAIAGTAKEAFVRNFTANHGNVVESKEKLVEFLKSKNCKTGLVDAKLDATFDLEKSFDISRDFNRSTPDAYDFGISKASFAIAENGGIVLKDSDTDDRLNTIAPWIHISVLNEGDIVKTIGDGLSKTLDNPYSIYIVSPSKTADVEGILVEGVHGPGIEVVLFVK